MASVSGDQFADSGDYTRFGIPDAPDTTVTTPFGNTRTCAGLLAKEKWFLALSFLNINILVAMVLATYRLVEDDQKNVTFTILLLVNAVFMAFYAFHGVLRERKYELYAHVVAILVILVYCIVEYSVNTNRHNTVKLVRLIFACVLAPSNIILCVLVAKEFGELEFRITGASENLQYIYNQAAIFSCWLKFDLQVTVSLLILFLQDGTLTGELETITIVIGIPYALNWGIFGWLVLRLELKIGAFIFAFLGLAKPAYYVYTFVKVYSDLEEQKLYSDLEEQKLYSELEEQKLQHDVIMYCVIICGALAVLAWLILMIELVIVYRKFGQGLKERGRISFWAFTLTNEIGRPRT